LWSGWSDALIISNLRLSCRGIVLATVCFGAGGLGKLAGQRQIRKFAN
jgi:hypothetical protein